MQERHINLIPNIEKMREAQEMSRAELAKQVGITYEYLVQLEAGKRKSPSLLIIYKMSRVLGCAMDDLYVEAV